ncbi:hypothetical protein [Acinetobacter higginsii]|uniref:hypothetical protein n=1 Tax=Acinetobacter higginsii TaxID=70347 RepID=UPI001F4A7DAC|nr:hypothetical protein [Acinetobacter higginsii]MCH7297240.1 hypothetical protein [Acinetobacter higginsii]
MNTAYQLLKEFWLPFAIAFVWTIINVLTSRETGWSFPQVINIAAPTFFFVSWLTAQYFRVKKQEHVSTTLTSIETRVSDAIARLDTQTNNLATLLNTKLVQTFDECIDSFREAKEELADKSRQVKSSAGIDAAEFILNRGNPFYQARRSLDMLIGYASYAATSEQEDLLKERFTRCSYHIEELAGHLGTFIGRLNHQKIAWKTPRAAGLVNQIVDSIERFERNLLSHSRYDTEPYKNGQNLRELMQSQIVQLRKYVA